jgi:hypothetical protein
MADAAPQLTFTDSDVKNLRSFLELVRDKATFSVNMEDSILLARHIAFMQQHIKQVHDHVMELVRVVEPAKAEPKKTK